MDIVYHHSLIWMDLLYFPKKTVPILWHDYKVVPENWAWSGVLYSEQKAIKWYDKHFKMWNVKEVQTGVSIWNAFFVLL